MINCSRCSRNGIIKKAPVEGLFSPGGGSEVPFVAFELYSEFEIGFREIKKETARVLLIGPAASWWKKLSPAPSVGDEVDIRYGIFYYASDGICIRVESPEFFRVIPQNIANAQKQDVTEYVDAVEWFRQSLTASQENDKN